MKGALSEADTQTIAECLDAVLSGVFIEETEFCCTAGASFEDVARVRDAWPDVQDRHLTIQVVNGALNDLLGYPHRQERRWHESIRATPDEVTGTFRRWRLSQGLPWYQ